MRTLFDRSFVYNWTVSPDEPGLIDFFLFVVKSALLTMLLVLCGYLLFGASGVMTVGTSVVLMPAIIEEQARVFWVWQANRKLRAALMFAVFLGAFEFIERTILSGVFTDATALASLLGYRLVPTAVHFLLSFLAVALIANRVSVGVVWVVCVFFHASYNAFVH